MNERFPRRNRDNRSYIGAPVDAYGRTITAPPANNGNNPTLLNNGQLSAPHDFSAFDAIFHKNDASKASGPFSSMPVGGSRVIPDQPKQAAPQPVGQTVAQPIAMEIDPRYRTQGASPIARSNTGVAPTGPGRIVDETGDRTADFAAGGRYSSQQAQPVKMTITPDQAKALIAAYPNLGQQGHSDIKSFNQAFRQAFDPRKPMSNEDVMNVAHGLFAPKSQIGQVGSDKFGTAPGSPGYVSPVDAGDFSAPSIVGQQAPVNFAGANVGAVPWNPITAPETAAGKMGAKIASAVSGGTSNVMGAMKDLGQDIGRTIVNNAVAPVYNFGAGLVGAKSQIAPMQYAKAQRPTSSADLLGTRTPQEIADWQPNVDVTTPITFPKFTPGGKSTAPTPPASIASFGQDDDTKRQASNLFSFPNSL